jgi:hypothetical protein
MADNPMDAYTKAVQRVTAAGLADGSWKLMAPGGRQIYPDPAFGASGPRQDDDIPELPGEFVDDPMAPGTYIIKYTDPQGQQQQTAVDANSADGAKEWFQSNHPSTYRVTDVYRHTA